MLRGRSRFPTQMLTRPSVTICGDTTGRLAETFTVTFIDPTAGGNGLNIGTAVGTGTITNDDGRR